MIKIPSKIMLKLINADNKEPILLPNLIIFIKIFALRKNDFNLGPFFTDNRGEIIIDKNVLEISADAEIQSGIMDYSKLQEGSSLIEIRVLSEEETAQLIQGRKMWGISDKEKEIYGSKKDLLNRIKNNNNNVVVPYFLRVSWDENTPNDVYYDLKLKIKDKLRK